MTIVKQSSLLLIVFLTFLPGCSGSLSLTQKAQQYIEKGQHASDEGHFERARNEYQKAIKTDSMLTAAYGGIIEVYLAESRTEKAAEFVQTIPVSIRSHPEISFFRGLVAARQKRYNEALPDLEWSVAANYNRTEAIYVMADIYVQTGDYERAVDLLESIRFAKEPAAQNDKLVALYDRAKSLLDDYLRDTFEGRTLSRIVQSRNVTRSDLAFLLVYELNLAKKDSLSFPDVSADDSLASFYSTAVASGVLEKLPDKKFYPGYRIKRRNVAYYLARLAKDKLRKDWEIPPPPEMQPDDVTVEDPQYAEISWMCANGIMKNLTGQSFGPDEPVAGADLLRALKKIKEFH